MMEFEFFNSDNCLFLYIIAFVDCAIGSLPEFFYDFISSRAECLVSQFLVVLLIVMNLHVVFELLKPANVKYSLTAIQQALEYRVELMNEFYHK